MARLGYSGPPCSRVPANVPFTHPARAKPRSLWLTGHQRGSALGSRGAFAWFQRQNRIRGRFPQGPQAGVEVQFMARQCVPTPLDGSQVIERRPRSKTPPESLRGPVVRRSGRPGWLPGRPRASALAKASPTCRFPRQIESGGRRSVEIKRPTPVPPKIGRAPPGGFAADTPV